MRCNVLGVLLMLAVVACASPRMSSVADMSVSPPDSLRQRYEKLECGAASLPHSTCQTLLSAMLDSAAANISPTTEASSGGIRQSICDEAMTTLAISECMDSLSAVARQRIALVTKHIRQQLLKANPRTLRSGGK